MKIKWYEIEIEKIKVYEALAWENGNKLLLLEHYTTKAEAVKAVKAVKKSYKGSGKLDCYVRYFDHKNGTTQDFNL